MTFQGVLKYNSVFVTDESLNVLKEQGFGAVRFNVTVERYMSFLINSFSLHFHPYSSRDN
jgi:hypothetical protein